MDDQGKKHRRLRAPSPAMIVALVALVFAMSGTAVAASKLVNGDGLIKKSSLSGNRLRDHSVAGIKLSRAVFGTQVRLAGRAFTPTKSTTTYDYVSGGGKAWAGGGPGAFSCPLQLPQDAMVGKLTVYGSGTVYLAQEDLTGSGRYSDPPLAGSQEGSKSLTLDPAWRIDNTKYAYSIIWMASNENTFWGVRVDYKMR